QHTEQRLDRFRLVGDPEHAVDFLDVPLPGDCRPPSQVLDDQVFALRTCHSQHGTEGMKLPGVVFRITNVENHRPAFLPLVTLIELRASGPHPVTLTRPDALANAAALAWAGN